MTKAYMCARHIYAAGCHSESRCGQGDAGLTVQDIKAAPSRDRFRDGPAYDTGAGASFRPDQPADELYIDRDDETGGHWFVNNGTIAAWQTRYQVAEILEFAHFGRALMLDGRVQSTERDEYIYHEALVQPALCLHSSPRRVLIIGGGEGATAREVLKHPTIENVVMVDVDGELVGLAREHLSAWHCDAFDDPRLKLAIRDGYDFIDATTERYNVIIVDIVDSFEGSPAEALYTAEFYKILKERLTPAGILVIQAMECDASEWEDHLRVRRSLEGLFRYLSSYLAFVPSYGSTWGFVMASDSIDPSAIQPAFVDKAIAERKLAERLRFYDGRTHQGLFALPKDLRRLLGAD
jgi:spermidine synthase